MKEFKSERYFSIGCIVIFVVGARFGLTAIQQAREAPRREQCKENLKQMQLAMAILFDMFEGHWVTIVVLAKFVPQTMIDQIHKAAKPSCRAILHTGGLETVAQEI